jgi:hypothetical protein
MQVKVGIPYKRAQKLAKERKKIEVFVAPAPKKRIRKRKKKESSE